LLLPVPLPVSPVLLPDVVPLWSPVPFLCFLWCFLPLVVPVSEVEPEPLPEPDCEVPAEPVLLVPDCPLDEPDPEPELPVPLWATHMVAASATENIVVISFFIFCLSPLGWKYWEPCDAGIVMHPR
jgi:hypothetical protein